MTDWLYIVVLMKRSSFTITLLEHSRGTLKHGHLKDDVRSTILTLEHRSRYSISVSINLAIIYESINVFLYLYMGKKSVYCICPYL